MFIARACSVVTVAPDRISSIESGVPYIEEKAVVIHFMLTNSVSSNAK